MEDFTPVAMINSVPFALAVTNSLPVHSLAELIAYARVCPGELNYASSGPGSALHLSMERLRRLAGIELQHVPFRNYTEARTALMAGQIRGLAIGGLQRDRQLPELPTLAETWPGLRPASRTASSVRPACPRRWWSG